jgi:hypothetical protein
MQAIHIILKIENDVIKVICTSTGDWLYKRYMHMTLITPSILNMVLNFLHLIAK